MIAIISLFSGPKAKQNFSLYRNTIVLFNTQTSSFFSSVTGVKHDRIYFSSPIETDRNNLKFEIRRAKLLERGGSDVILTLLCRRERPHAAACRKT